MKVGQKSATLLIYEMKFCSSGREDRLLMTALKCPTFTVSYPKFGAGDEQPFFDAFTHCCVKSLVFNIFLRFFSHEC